MSQHQKGFVFTSNRDEKQDRLTLAPQQRTIHNHQMVFPLDLEHQGTWFSVDKKGKQLACLLNAKGPQPQPQSKISRGHIPFQFLLNESSLSSSMLLDKVAPFTLVKVSYNSKIELKEFIWNGYRLQSNTLDGLQPKLWCSNTLYGATKTQQLNSDFQQFLKLKSERHKIINFHKTKVQTYNSNEYLIKNKNLQTVSITSVISEGEVLKMRYWDMLDHKKTKFLQL